MYGQKKSIFFLSLFVPLSPLSSTLLPQGHDYFFFNKKIQGLPNSRGKHEKCTAVLSVFGVTEWSVRGRIPRPIYLYHVVRMTDGGFDTLIPAGTDDGWGGFGASVPVRKQKKLIFARQWRVVS